MQVVHVSPNGDVGGGAVLVKTLVENAPSVEHAIITDSGSDLATWAAARGLHVDGPSALVRFRSHAGLLHLHGVGALTLAAHSRAPQVVTLHGLHHRHAQRLLRSRLTSVLVARACRRDASMLVCVSETDRSALVSDGLPRDRVRVIPNPTMVPDGLARPTPRKDRPSSVLWVGRFDHVKDPVRALDIARRTLDVPWTMIGGGELLDSCRRSAPANVAFTGVLPREQVLAHMGTYPVVLNTSRHEGLPYVLVEAALRRACPVGPPVPGVDEIIELSNGTLIPDDPAAAADVVAATVDDVRTGARDEQLDHGVNVVAARFAVESNVARYEDLYRAVGAAA